MSEYLQIFLRCHDAYVSRVFIGACYFRCDVMLLNIKVISYNNIL